MEGSVRISERGRQECMLRVPHCFLNKRGTTANRTFRKAEKSIAVPEHYFPQDDPTRKPLNVWHGHANLPYANWLNYCVYQRTPFDLQSLEKETQ